MARREIVIATVLLPCDGCGWWLLGFLLLLVACNDALPEGDEKLTDGLNDSIGVELSVPIHGELATHELA